MDDLNDYLRSMDQLKCVSAKLIMNFFGMCFQYAGSDSFLETADYQLIVNNWQDFSVGDKNFMFKYDLHISCEIKYEFPLIKWLQSRFGKCADIYISRDRVSYDGCYEAYFDIKLDDVSKFTNDPKSDILAISDNDQRELSKIFWHDGTVPVPDYPLKSLKTKFDFNSNRTVDQLANAHFQRFTTLIEQHGYSFRRVGKQIAVDQAELKQLASFEKLYQIKPRTPATKNMIVIVNNQFDKSVFGKRLASQ